MAYFADLAVDHLDARVMSAPKELQVVGWDPVDAPLRSTPAARDPATLKQIAGQFDVLHNPRYANANGQTFCNRFASDVTRALGCEIPHQVGGTYLNVNATCDWLPNAGVAKGWSEAPRAEAEKRATFGFPTVALWRNPSGHGHIGVVLPNGKIACAGAAHLFDAPIDLAFPPYLCKPLRFFTHA